MTETSAFDQVLRTRRSIRRFTPGLQPPADDLVAMVEAGALAPSRSNRQIWDFVIVTDHERLGRLFDTILWGSVNPANRVFADPTYGPTAYICVIRSRQRIAASHQHEFGACIQNILLTAHARQISSLWLMAFKRSTAARILELPPDRIVDAMIGLGYAHQVAEVEWTAHRSELQHRVSQGCDTVVRKVIAQELTHWNTWSAGDETP